MLLWLISPIDLTIATELLPVNSFPGPKGVPLRTAAAGKASQVEEKLPSPAQAQDMRGLVSNGAARECYT